MIRKSLGVVMIWLTWLSVGIAQEQEVFFVQIEANRSLVESTDAARSYASRLPDVNGFAIGQGWYGIALGPYVRADAEQVLRVYRAEGVIARDSYLTRPEQYGSQFWPVGANVLGRGTVSPDLPETTPQAAAPAPEPEPEPEPADETPRQAQVSERSLTFDQRKELQIAMRWAGTYQGAIDGAYGRGTRNAMALWQEQNGYEKTGILTTLQRADLLRQYNAVLADLGLTEVINEAAGISMKIPTAKVALADQSAPFIQFNANADIPEARVILISQPGTQATLFGLYEIMQTLEIVPLDGDRTRGSDRFSITGVNSKIISDTRVVLRDGTIKGFTLVWPIGDEARRTRLLAEMEKSFARLEGVLPLDLALEEGGPIDLVAGLEVRTPRLSRSGFFVDSAGTVVTTAEAVDGCGRLTLENDLDATLLTVDAARGIAVLRPETQIAPRAVAQFSSASPRRASEVAVAGFSYEGVLGAPSMTFGRLSDLKGLAGEPELRRLAMAVLPGDAGGPVLDAGGGVFGMLLPRGDAPRSLPDEVNFAMDAETIRATLREAGTIGFVVDSSTPLDPIDLTSTAQDMTVLVSCWD